MDSDRTTSSNDVTGELTPRVGQPPTLPTVPSRLGPIRLIREIGRGGMGAVWLGHHELLDRRVAVKFILSIKGNRDSAAVNTFLEGARAAAAIRHPGLTTIHHADVVGEVPYIVMDWVDGASLAQIVHERGPLSVSQTLHVLRKTCEVLAALHEVGIVHRDIKPSNILIDRAGELYLTDFGLTCDRVPPGKSIKMRVSGTPGYMAPEMYDGVVSPRTDVYALGVTGYE